MLTATVRSLRRLRRSRSSAPGVSTSKSSRSWPQGVAETLWERCTFSFVWTVTILLDGLRRWT